MKAELHRVLLEAPLLGALTEADFARAALGFGLAASIATLLTLACGRNKVA